MDLIRVLGAGTLSVISTGKQKNRKKPQKTRPGA